MLDAACTHPPPLRAATGESARRPAGAPSSPQGQKEGGASNAPLKPSTSKPPNGAPTQTTASAGPPPSPAASAPSPPRSPRCSQSPPIPATGQPRSPSSGTTPSRSASGRPKPPTASTTRLRASQAFQGAFSSNSDPLFRASGPNNNPRPRPHIPFRPLWPGFLAFQGVEPCWNAACTHPPPLRAATGKSARRPGRHKTSHLTPHNNQRVISHHRQQPAAARPEQMLVAS